MIVPTSRLLFWVAVVILPFSVVGAVLPALLAVSLCLIFLLLLLALVDAALGFDCLKGIDLKLPEVVRLSKDRLGAIELRIKNEAQKRRALRIGLAFPREIQPSREDLHVSLPARSEW